jgi:RNA polymerase sigma-70 factor (ECF subfamily)
MNAQESAAIRALQRGDTAGLAPLFEVYQLRAIRTAYLIVGERQIAEDVVADAFLTVYDRIGQFDDRRPFAPWFYRIVVNGALMALRRARRQGTGHAADAMVGPWPVATPGPDQVVLQRELRHDLLAAIDALPPPQRAVVVLYYYLEMDEATIARTLDCPVGTVKWRLYAARRRLRRQVEELGITTEYA